MKNKKMNKKSSNDVNILTEFFIQMKEDQDAAMESLSKCRALFTDPAGVNMEALKQQFDNPLNLLTTVISKKASYDYSFSLFKRTIKKYGIQNMSDVSYDLKMIFEFDKKRSDRVDKFIDMLKGVFFKSETMSLKKEKSCGCN
jgi:hypothetical protein